VYQLPKLALFLTANLHNVYSVVKFVHQNTSYCGVCDWKSSFIKKLRVFICLHFIFIVNHLYSVSEQCTVSDACRLLSDVGRRPLRSNSNDMRKLLVPRTHNKLGDRSFSAAGPRLWNDLPPGLRRPGLTFDSLRQSLKTHLFGDRSA